MLQWQTGGVFEVHSDHNQIRVSQQWLTCCSSFFTSGGNFFQFLSLEVIS